jgi:hypothetical protein
MLYVTHHAVERFIKRWRPGTAVAEARRLLEELAAHAGPTRRRTLPRDATIYTTMTDAGERVLLAVRDGAVITVLDPEPAETARFGGVDPEDPLYADSAATRRECLAMLEAERVAERARARSAAKASTRARRKLANQPLTAAANAPNAEMPSGRAAPR